MPAQQTIEVRVKFNDAGFLCSLRGLVLLMALWKIENGRMPKLLPERCS